MYDTLHSTGVKFQKIRPDWIVCRYCKVCASQFSSFLLKFRYCKWKCRVKYFSSFLEAGTFFRHIGLTPKFLLSLVHIKTEANWPQIHWLGAWTTNSGWHCSNKIFFSGKVHFSLEGYANLSYLGLQDSTNNWREARKTLRSGGLFGSKV